MPFLVPPLPIPSPCFSLPTFLSQALSCSLSKHISAFLLGYLQERLLMSCWPRRHRLQWGDGPSKPSFHSAESHVMHHAWWCAPGGFLFWIFPKLTFPYCFPKSSHFLFPCDLFSSSHSRRLEQQLLLASMVIWDRGSVFGEIKNCIN